MKSEILVIGAGMVGTCTALELALRGHTVTLLDRRAPGQETSYGNAGVIQREAVEPYPMPRKLGFLLSAALGRDPSVSYHPSAVLAALPRLWQYWRASAPGRHAAISRDYAALIAHATSEHARLMQMAGADALVRREGLRLAFRTGKPFAAALQDAARLERRYGIGFRALDSTELARAEPAFHTPLAGAVDWLDSWSVSDPGKLVERYAALFQQRGGRLVQGDGLTLRQCGAAWQADSVEGRIDAAHAVIALGPWAETLTRRLGYRLPLFVKRGYHRHYAGGAQPAVPTLDAERGYVMSPQSRGLRITTGAEIARIDARPTPQQLALAEQSARQLLDLGTPVEPTPWMGSRPCVADMLPVIGGAGWHAKLWFNFGHGHQGFTLGPASARLLADLIDGVPPFIDARGYSPQRFLAR
ncbi:NAD(P)/FAD-dependent oxidoreductase [Pseudoduganella violacea]|uniref:D-amino-acid dehydrogenase n=1 Tax=Pseudoduganella violacea TaxID=1715466 RepID=A0A7W5BDM1_9BURK|nr:FAD-dependent oxidoreductase [Pseudoduganella violacea]MBB3120993.1 D-amino-acid dehydrogenase [Pseudoduganella violacea]